MAKRNVTVSIDQEAHRRGRMWAAEHDTTLSALVCYCIEHLPDLPVARRAVDSIHRQRNSMAELTSAIERLSGQLSASQNNPNTPCVPAQPAAAKPSQPDAPAQ